MCLRAASATVTASARSQEGANLLQARLQQQLQTLPAEDAVLVTRMCGHYLKLSGIAEQLHMCAPPSPVYGTSAYSGPSVPRWLHISADLGRCVHIGIQTERVSPRCRVRCAKGPDYEFSHGATFDRLQKNGCTPDAIYKAICTQARPPPARVRALTHHVHRRHVQHTLRAACAQGCHDRP